MEAEVVASLVAAVASLVVALVSLVQSRSAQRDAANQSAAQMLHEQRLKDVEAGQQGQLTLLNDELARRRWQEEQRQKREEVANRFREPLARAAYDLQSRLWNVLNGRFLVYLAGGTPREQAYVLENTAFLVAQYFAWTEIVRREIQIIDLREEAETGALAHQQDRISALWGSDHLPYGGVFRIWSGEQRAIGELLIEESESGPRCMGYARFMELLRGDHSPFLDLLTEEIRALPRHPRPRRLVDLQHALIDQLEVLDRQFIRFPRTTRTKVTVAADAAGPSAAAPEDDPAR